MNKIKIALLLLVVLVAAAFGGFQLFFRSAVPKYTGTIALEGLSAPVQVWTDDYGVPHIVAASETDLFFAQGYITARERLFRMDSGGVIRMVVDFADPERSTLISPPGQSGHYLSPHYDDTARLWAEGKQIPMHFYSYERLAKKMVLAPR